MIGVGGKWIIEGVNENGENLVDVCAEREIVLNMLSFNIR